MKNRNILTCKEFQGAHTDEQEERDGRGEGGQNEVQEVGGQLVAQVGGLPCPTPSCKPAGGEREVKTRLEEPGGGWRMEVLNNPFIFTQRDLEDWFE